MTATTVCVNRTCAKRRRLFKSVYLFLEPGCPHHSPIREGDRIVSEEESDARTMKKP